MENEQRPEHRSDDYAAAMPLTAGMVRHGAGRSDVEFGYWDGPENSEPFTHSVRRAGPTVPGPPGAQAVTHHQLEIAAAQPGQFFREHRHTLLPGTGHFRDVRPPKHAGGSECIEDLAKIRLHAGVRVAAARVARRTSGLDCDVGMSGELHKVGNVRHGGGVFA